MEKKKQAGSLLQIRMDERLRYLTSLATAATGKTLTEFVTDALISSFDKISLYKRPTIERVYGDASSSSPELYDFEEERVQREAMNLGRQANLLWDESPITRLEVLEVVAPHLLPSVDQQLLDFVRTIDEYKIMQGSTWKLNRKKVDAEWDSIMARFTKRIDKSKGRAK